jgi:hypothetical protein
MRRLHNNSLLVSEFFGFPHSSHEVMDIEPAVHLSNWPNKKPKLSLSSPFHPADCEMPPAFSYCTPEWEQMEKARAFAKHWAGMGYLDTGGRLLHDSRGVPEVYVMMIAPSLGQEGDGTALRSILEGIVEFQHPVTSADALVPRKMGHIQGRSTHRRMSQTRQPPLACTFPTSEQRYRRIR